MFLPTLSFAQTIYGGHILGGTRLTSDEPLEHTQRWVFNDSVRLVAIAIIKVDGKEFFKVGAIHFAWDAYKQDPHHMGYIAVTDKHKAVRDKMLDEQMTSLDIICDHKVAESVSLIQNGVTLFPMKYMEWSQTHLYYRVKTGPVELHYKNKFSATNRQIIVNDVSSPLYLDIRQKNSEVAKVDLFYTDLLASRRHSKKYFIQFDFRESDDHYYYNTHFDSISWDGKIEDGFAVGKGKAYLHLKKDSVLVYSGELVDGLPQGYGCLFGSYYTLCGRFFHGELYERRSFLHDLNAREKITKPAGRKLLETSSESWRNRDTLGRMHGLFRKMTVNTSDSKWYFSHLLNDSITPRINPSLMPALNSCARHVFMFELKQYRIGDHHMGTIAEGTSYSFLVQCPDNSIHKIELGGPYSPKEKDEKALFSILEEEIKAKCSCKN